MSNVTEINAELTLEEMIAELTEQQAKFILHASVIANHLPMHWLIRGIKLAEVIRT